MMVLQVEGVYYDVHREDGQAYLVRFENGEPVRAVAVFVDPQDADPLEEYLSEVAKIVKHLEEESDDGGVFH